MSMIHRLLKTIFGYFGRFRIINDRMDREPYLERYYLFLKERTTFPFNIFLHRFLKSDPDVLHNHPWSYRSIILFGGYWEHKLDGVFWRGPLSYIYAPANTYHRVELDEQNPYCWTLFMPGPKQQSWGFLTEKGHIDNETYLADKKREQETKNTNYDNENNKDNENIVMI